MTITSEARVAASIAEQKLLWAPLYERVLNLIGSTGVIIPLGDTNHEAANRTTCTTVGEEQVAFTYSEAVTSFDTPPTFKGPGRIPTITFNGTDEEADSPDAVYWTRALVPMSVGAWANFSGGNRNSSIFFQKFVTTTGSREWIFDTDGSGHFRLVLYDEDDAVTPNAVIVTTGDVALSATAWVFIVATYDGTADASGINLYVDGAVVASTDVDDANFASMRDKGGSVQLAHRTSGPAKFFDGQMAGGPLGPFFTQAELSADGVKRLYQLGRAVLSV